MTMKRLAAQVGLHRRRAPLLTPAARTGCGRGTLISSAKQARSHRVGVIDELARLLLVQRKTQCRTAARICRRELHCALQCQGSLPSGMLRHGVVSHTGDILDRHMPARKHRHREFSKSLGFGSGARMPSTPTLVAVSPALFSVLWSHVSVLSAALPQISRAATTAVMITIPARALFPVRSSS